MTDSQQRAAAKNFSKVWSGRGYEKGDSQKFWLQLLSEVYGVEHPAQFIEFEEQVHPDHTGFIDGSIPSTRVLIEQKGLDKDMKKPIRQSDGTFLRQYRTKIVRYCHKYTDKTLTKAEYVDWLKGRYHLDFAGLSFKITLSSFFRIYGEQNFMEFIPDEEE